MMALLMGVRSISAADLHDLVRRHKVAVYDCNSRQSWASAHVPGATHLDAREYGAGQLPSDKSSPLVFYCGNPLCRKAPIAARRASRMGYGDVRVMSAGISGWLAAKLPTEAG
jgi:rhodanese-related sulfurtransferase